MKKAITFLTTAAIFAMGCASCQKNNNTTDGKGGSKGYVSGKVTNTQGQPVSGAQVYISSDVFFNSGSQTTSDANGNYKIQIPPVNSLRAFARMLVNYNNKPYLVYMDPDHPQSFTSEDA